MNGGRRLGMRASAGLSLGTSQRLDPRVILGTKLVMMDQVELEERINQELTENPALERLESEESFFISTEIEPSSVEDPYFQSREYERCQPSGDNEFDLTASIGQRTSLEDHMLAQLSLRLSEPDLEIAEVIVGAIDSRGYLGLEVEQIAIIAECELEQVERILGIVQSCEPAGIAARTVQECLCLQLQREVHPLKDIAIRIVNEGGLHFVRRDISKLRRQLKVSSGEVEEAYDLIRGLDPYPGEGFQLGEAAGSFKALPELSFDRDESGWTIEIRGAKAKDFSVNRIYLKTSSDGNPADRKHARHFVDRAQMFLSALEQREQTLRQIALYLIEKQGAFLATGQYRYLTELTRAQLAIDLSIDPGSVTRATKGKCVRIATGEVVPYSVIFDSKLRAQELITELLAQERPDRPWTDDEIAQHLRAQGIVAARRTVNKYRNQARHLSSRSRKIA